MLNSAVFDQMLQRLGNRKSPSLRATCVSMMNTFIMEQELGPVFPPFLETMSSGLVTTIGQAYVDLPANFIREVDNGNVQIQEGTSILDMTKVYHSTIQNENVAGTLAKPKAYSLFGNKMYFNSTPDKVYTILLPYYAKSSLVEDNDQEVTGWLLHAQTVTVYGTLVSVASEILQDAGMMQTFLMRYGPARKKFDDLITAREEANGATSMED